MTVKFYYRLKPIGLDVADERELKRYCEELTSFRALDQYFFLLETAYNDKLKERDDIIVNALPSVNGVAELAVFHNIRYKLFSRTVKYQKFSLCATYCDDFGGSRLYFYDTQDIVEVKNIFERFVIDREIPDFNTWEKVDMT